MASKPIEIDIAADLLKLLSDRTRLTILKLLEIKELCVCELVELFNMSQPAISQHLRKLRDAKLVKEERRGQWVYYSLYKEHEAFIFVKNICDSIPSQAPLLKRYDGNDICCK